MKILIVSDIVNETILEYKDGQPFLAGIDLIISCGDLPPEYLTSLRSRYDVPLFYVLGNHDLRYQTSPPVGCRKIDRRFIEYNGLRILGFSGSRWYNGNQNQYTERQMTGFIRKMWFTLWRKKGFDILVSHASPRYINDAEDRCHRGFHSFRQLINRHQPQYHLHGHIHKLFDNESDRFATLGETEIINCYDYYILEIEPSCATETTDHR